MKEKDLALVSVFKCLSPSKWCSIFQFPRVRQQRVVEVLAVLLCLGEWPVTTKMTLGPNSTHTPLSSSET